MLWLLFKHGGILLKTQEEKRKSWEAIPCVGDVPTPEELLKYAVEKIKEIECEDLLKW